MSFLLCSGCRRHVKGAETACPFCGTVTSAASPAGNASLAGARSRQRLLFGAASTAASVVVSAAVIAGCSTTPDTSFVFMYGAPNVDAAADDGGDAGAVAIYGSPIFGDAGDASDDAPSAVAAYGLPIFDDAGDAGSSDAGDGGD